MDARVSHSQRRAYPLNLRQLSRNLRNVGFPVQRQGTGLPVFIQIDAHGALICNGADLHRIFCEVQHGEVGGERGDGENISGQGRRGKRARTRAEGLALTCAGNGQRLKVEALQARAGSVHVDAEEGGRGKRKTQRELAPSGGRRSETWCHASFPFHAMSTLRRTSDSPARLPQSPLHSTRPRESTPGAIRPARASTPDENGAPVRMRCKTGSRRRRSPCAPTTRGSYLAIQPDKVAVIVDECEQHGSVGLECVVHKVRRRVLCRGQRQVR